MSKTTLRATLYVLISALTYVQTALKPGMTAFEYAMIGVGAIAAALVTLRAYVDQSVSREEQAQQPEQPQ